MKKLFLILLLLPCLAFAGDFKVIDGDTISIINNKPDLSHLPLSIRLLNIDTPEIKGKCDKEKKLALEARKFVHNIVNNPKNKITYNLVKNDKYGGRVLGYIYVNGEDLSKIMIANKLARSYDGKKKSNWCN